MVSIHHDIQLSCSNENVFQALTGSERFAVFSASPTRIDAVRGGEFSCFGDLITGITVDIVPNQRLVQAGRVFNWEDGVYSIAKFELRQISRTETRLIFDHIGFPEAPIC